MVSLLELATITEEGVKFISPHNGTEMMLTPEESMTVQNSLGADIMMALDDVCSTTTEGVLFSSPSLSFFLSLFFLLFYFIFYFLFF